MLGLGTWEILFLLCDGKEAEIPSCNFSKNEQISNELFITLIQSILRINGQFYHLWCSAMSIFQNTVEEGPTKVELMPFGSCPFQLIVWRSMNLIFAIANFALFSLARLIVYILQAAV